MVKIRIGRFYELSIAGPLGVNFGVGLGLFERHLGRDSSGESLVGHLDEMGQKGLLPRKTLTHCNAIALHCIFVQVHQVQDCINHFDYIVLVLQALNTAVQR